MTGHSQPWRIVLVEDNVGDVYLMRMALEKAALDCELTVIEDGAEALRFCGRDGKYHATPIPDMVVLDLNLPMNEGLEVLQAMRSHPYLKMVPVVITSSSGSPADHAEAERLGVERYIIKPTDLESFLEIGTVLKEMLESSKL